MKKILAYATIFIAITEIYLSFIEIANLQQLTSVLLKPFATLAS